MKWQAAEPCLFHQISDRGAFLNPPSGKIKDLCPDFPPDFFVQRGLRAVEGNPQRAKDQVDRFIMRVVGAVSVMQVMRGEGPLEFFDQAADGVGFRGNDGSPVYQ